MKKIIALAIASAMTLAALHARDWAGYNRYKAQNDSIIAAQEAGAARPAAVLIGDSITEVWQKLDPDFFPAHNIVGRGISGQGTYKILARIRRDVIDLHPEYAVILIGTNDLALNDGYLSKDNIFGNIVSMTEILCANGITPVLCSILPATGYGWRPEAGNPSADIIALNSLIRRYAEDKSFTYIDYHSPLANGEGGMKAEYSEDGVHENAACLRVMEEVFLSAMSGRIR